MVVFVLALACAHQSAAPEEAAPAAPVAQPATPQAPEPAMKTYEGTAYNAKQGALLDTDDDGQIWVDLDEWPDEVLGERLTVTGRYETRADQPVFVAEPGAPQKSGIPVAPGTDLDAASKRDVLTDLTWERVAL